MRHPTVAHGRASQRDEYLSGVLHAEPPPCYPRRSARTALHSAYPPEPGRVREERAMIVRIAQFGHLMSHPR
jgi:hypothetical protein